jgi:hypothetical protein
MYRFAGILFALIFLLVACQAGGNTLKPIRPEPTPVGPFDGRPIPVSFPDLNDNPGAYRDKLIRVSGTYTRLPLPTCEHTSGPRLEWALVSGNLRLDARGFEPVLRLLPGGIILTVDGFWRQYEGPLGCGKEAADGAAWYLETLQIIQPNPLPGVFEAGVSPGIDQLPEPLAPTPDGTAEPELQITLIAGTPAVSVTPSPTGSRVPTGTPSRTPTVFAPGTATATPSRTATAPITGTPPTVTPTPTPSRTPPPGATQPGPSTSIPPATPPGYPGPEPTIPTPTPSPSPPGYP